MKNKIILAVSTVLILALGIVAFAVNQSKNSNKTAAADSCAMKMQSADGASKTSCCDKPDCCCKGDACPMKTKGESASANCCSCCGDACPMKSNDAQASSVDMKNVTVIGGESCGSGGACCKTKQNKS